MGYDHMHLRLVLLKTTRLYVQIHSVLYFPSGDAKVQRGYVPEKGGVSVTGRPMWETSLNAPDEHRLAVDAR